MVLTDILDFVENVNEHIFAVFPLYLHSFIQKMSLVSSSFELFKKVNNFFPKQLVQLKA